MIEFTKILWDTCVHNHSWMNIFSCLKNPKNLYYTFNETWHRYKVSSIRYVNYFYQLIARNSIVYNLSQVILGDHIQELTKSIFKSAIKQVRIILSSLKVREHRHKTQYLRTHNNHTLHDIHRRMCGNLDDRRLINKRKLISLQRKYPILIENMSKKTFIENTNYISGMRITSST